MKQLSLLVALLATLNLVACTRIVKHYHYHFAVFSFPVSTNNDTFAVMNEFIAKNYASLSENQRYAIEFMRGEAFNKMKTLDFFLHPESLALYARYSGLSCQEMISLMKRIVVFEDNKSTLDICKEEFNYLESAYDNRRLRPAKNIQKGG